MAVLYWNSPAAFRSFVLYVHHNVAIDFSTMRCILCWKQTQKIYRQQICNMLRSRATKIKKFIQWAHVSSCFSLNFFLWLCKCANWYSFKSVTRCHSSNSFYRGRYVRWLRRGTGACFIWNITWIDRAPDPNDGKAKGRLRWIKSIVFRQFRVKNSLQFISRFFKLKKFKYIQYLLYF